MTSIPKALSPFALLTSAFLFLFSALVAGAETPKISAPEALKKLQAGEMVILDIRAPEEWAESGVAEGVWPVSMHQRDFGKNLQRILRYVPADRIGLICATGGRSDYVAGVLEKNGIFGVIDVSEGMFGNKSGPGWIKRGLPLVHPDAALRNYEAATANWGAD